MTADSLIGKLQSLEGGALKGFPLQAYMQGVAECIEIIRQHFTSPEVMERVIYAIYRHDADFYPGESETSGSRRFFPVPPEDCSEHVRQLCNEQAEAALKAAVGAL